MPILLQGRQLTITVVGHHPVNSAEAGLATIPANIQIYDVAMEAIFGIGEGRFATLQRTGTVSAIVSRLLALPDSRTLGLIGCGSQAVSQVHGLSRVFLLRRILVYDIDRDCTASFGRRVGLSGFTVEPADLAVLARERDIICTGTSVGVREGPVVQPLEHQPNLHVNAVDSDLPGKTELPLSFLRRSLICPDFIEQVVHEGECQQRERAPRSTAAGQTVFDSTGFTLGGPRGRFGHPQACRAPGNRPVDPDGRRRRR